MAKRTPAQEILEQFIAKVAAATATEGPQHLLMQANKGKELGKANDLLALCGKEMEIALRVLDLWVRARSREEMAKYAHLGNVLYMAEHDGLPWRARLENREIEDQPFGEVQVEEAPHDRFK